MDWTARVKAAFEDRPLPDDDVIEELAQHAAALYQAARAEGCVTDEANARVERQLATWTRDGSLLHRRRRRTAAPVPPPTMPSGRRWPGSFTWLADVRFALRLLGRERGYALLVIGTMALGISAVTVLFSIAYGVLLKPLPWPESDRLIRLYESREGATRPATRFTNAAYLAWQERPTTIEGLGGWSVSRRIVTIGRTRERVPVIGATPTLFGVLRVRPVLGSLFATRDGAPADEREVLISRGLWQQRFGGRHDVLGRTIDIDGDGYHLVGVVPDRFPFIEDDANIWIPFRIKPVLGPEPGMRSLSMFGAIARLRPGATAPQAAAEGTSRGRTAPDAGPVAMAVFGSNGPVIVTTESLLDSIAGEVRPALVVLMAAVILLLVTATANVASLQLARALQRRREMAVRSAIGAPAPRLMRQLLTENVLLGAMGGITGLTLAAWVHRALPWLLPSQFPRAADVSMDWRVAAFTALVGIATGLAFGLAPALHARRVDLVSTLNEDASAPVGVSVRTRVARARSAIMAAQIAVACVLLVGAVLLARSFSALASAPRGYDASNVLTCRVVMPDTSFTPAARDNAMRALLARLQSRPEVRRVAFTTAMPLASGDIVASFPMRSPRTGADVQVSTTLRYVSPDYFAALGIRILEGRPFTANDNETAPRAVVVNRTFARRYLDDTPLDDAVPGRKNDQEVKARVVGIIDDVRQEGMSDPVQPELYRSMLQSNEAMEFDYPLLVVRTAGDPLKLAPEVRALVSSVAPSALVEKVESMEAKLGESLARPRLYAVLLVVFATAALLIAAVGLFGVLAYSVTLRSREIGVRTALGASPRAIVLLVLRQSARVTAIGLIAGLAIAYVAGQSLGSFLYGIRPHDAASFASVAVVLLLAAALATVGPARRAASVDPLTVLK
jgi:predicted permease